jgi:phosphohistidine swiveling domain-containing protein
MSSDSLIIGLTKGKTLQKLSSICEKDLFAVPELYLLDVDNWKKDFELCLIELADIFGNSELIVRSSASDEDSETSAKAGEYHSVLNVSAKDTKSLANAINAVITSYVSKGLEDKGQEVLIQCMVRDVVCSGVIFTHELNTGAPYYVVNYDDSSGSTESVTSGSGEYSNRTLYIHRSSFEKIKSPRFKALIDAVRELEATIGWNFLDIEFAIDKRLKPFLLQVRYITTKINWNRGIVRSIDIELSGITSFVKNRLQATDGVLGKTTVLGQMPDWNPAEMIGRAPRALSFSLYRRLITDDAWRLARKRMGYAVPHAQPLMVSLAGQPFIDSRLSFHSFLPKGLPSVIGNKLVNEWVERLRVNPQFHDKVEFDVAITTFTFDIDHKIQKLASSLTNVEKDIFKENLLKLSHTLIASDGLGSIKKALLDIEYLTTVEFPDRSTGPLGLKRLIDDCVSCGTIPFSILARHGFIAKSLLLSLVSRNIISNEDMNNFLGGVKTVAGDMLNEINLVRTSEKTRAEFMTKFGHLRPGTYDLLSSRYDQLDSFDAFGGNSEMVNEGHCKFEFTSKQQYEVEKLLLENDFQGVSFLQFIEYIKQAISGREYGKFVFTKSVSAMLELIAEFGESNNLSREEMSHIPVDEILKVALESCGQTVEEKFRMISRRNAERHSVTSAIRLPQVLSDISDVHIIPFQVCQPNFITSKKISASCLYLGLHDNSKDLSDEIVLIENADPGYDWIFSQPILGLITKYGGANSHMAIRCAEFGIPAAIGCGEQRFDRLVKASHVSLDCATGTINPVNSAS